MPYRAGYQGDYRRGHQGGFGLVAALGGGLLKRGLGALGRRLTGRGAARMAATTAAAVAVPAAVQRTSVAASRLPPVPMPGGGQFRPLSLGPGGTPAFTPGECPKGHRLNKTGYFLKSGAYIPPRSKCVKIRRRNFANGRALRRSITRAKGFERLVKSNRKALRSLSKI